MELYHVSGWHHLSEVQVGDTFVLHPGQQNAEGIGVYFAEGVPRLSAAEGAHMLPSAIVIIEAVDRNGWWLSKGAKAKKFNKARTWHSASKSLRCQILSIENSQMRCLRCIWEWGN